jgi:hypothetical protein
LSEKQDITWLYESCLQEILSVRIKKDTFGNFESDVGGRGGKEESSILSSIPFLISEGGHNPHRRVESDVRIKLRVMNLRRVGVSSKLGRRGSDPRRQ